MNQERDIRNLYANAANEVQKRIDRTSRETASGRSMNYIMRQLKKELVGQVKQVSKDLESLVSGNAQAAGKAAMDDQINWLKGLTKVNEAISGKMYRVSTKEVEAVLAGKVYKDDWTFSKAIWGIEKKTTDDINRIVAMGMAANKSAYEIAQDLEKYVQPDARKEWDWSKVYPGTNKKIDYNAQRLARTLVSHSYQKTVARIASDNPFVKSIVWCSAFEPGRTCAQCEDLDGMHFTPATLPLDHPNGLCWYEYDIPDSYEDIGARLGDWAAGADDPELDAWLLK
jgi:hypothetical protein